MLHEDDASGAVVAQAGGEDLVEIVTARAGEPDEGGDPCQVDCDCRVVWQVQGLAPGQDYCFR